MKPKRFFFLLSGTVVLLGILIFAASIGGNLLLKKQSSKLADLRLESRVLEEQQTLLNRAKKDIQKYSELNTITKAIVPQDKDQAKTVRALNAIAQQSDIQLSAITFSSSNLGQAKVAAPKPATGTTNKSAAALPSQVTPVVGISGVYAQEITIDTDPDAPIPYPKFLEFLESLEASRRTAHVTKIVVNPSKDGGAVSFKLTLNAYIKP